MFLPKEVSGPVRVFRCFVQPKEEDSLYLEILGYSKFESDVEGVAQVNAILDCELLPQPNLYHGTKMKNIQDMYQRYVPN